MKYKIILITILFIQTIHSALGQTAVLQPIKAIVPTPLGLPDLQVSPGMRELSMCNLLKNLNYWHKTSSWSSAALTRAELDAKGYPLFSTFTSNAGVIYFGNSSARPNDVYPFLKDPNAVYVLTWTGDCDADLVTNFTLVSGSKAEHRKVYKQSKVGVPTICVKLTAGTNYEADPLGDLAMWMPNPSNPAQSMEGQTFNPLYVKMITDLNCGVLRFMDASGTNESAQINWTDRRPKSHPAQSKGPTGAYWCTNITPGTPNIYEDAGVAWEYLIDFCNTTNKDFWVNIPHGATDDYVTKLAQLIHGDDPDGTGQVGLNPNLHVWIEYSNEIWAGGPGFMQGQYAKDKATAAGITHGQWVATRACDIFKIFQDVFGGTNRLRRIAALWTANGGNYDTDYLARIQSYGATLTPAVKADVMAITTYFGNGIQSYILDSIDYTNPSIENYNKLFDLWQSNLLSSKASTTGRDVTGAISEQFGTWSAQYNLPIVAYEGGVGLPLTAKDTYYQGVRGSTGPGIAGSDFNIVTDATTGALKVLVESGTTNPKDTSFNVVGTKNICDNAWHQIAVVLPAGKSMVSDLQFYVDGVMDAIVPFNETNFKKGRDGIINTIPDKKLRIGMDVSYTFANCFNGNIDEVCIFNRGLSNAEIAGMFTGTTPTQNLEARWLFENNGNDISGNGNILNLENATYNSTAKEGSYSLKCLPNGLTGTYGYAEAENYKGIAGSAERTIVCWVKTSSKGDVIISWGKPGVVNGEITVIGALQCGQGDYNTSPYTKFVHGVLDHPRMKEMYKIQLGLVKGQGIVTHSNFQDIGTFSKWGQWAMKDNMMETDEQAPRYACVRDWATREAEIAEVFFPTGSRPKFNTPEMLPVAEKGTLYNAIISFGGGDGTILSDFINDVKLPSGLNFTSIENGIRISGTPVETGNYFLFVRILDVDNDPAYRIYTLQCVARSTGSTIINFEELIETGKYAPVLAEPILSKGYKITSSSGTALVLRGPKYWCPDNTSNAVKLGTWGQSLYISKADGGYFDLTQFDHKQNCGGSIKVSGTAANGVTFVKIINTPLNTNQTIKLDWVSVKKVLIEYSSGENFVSAGNVCRTGEIDNIVLNSTVSPIIPQMEDGTVTIPTINFLNLYEGATNTSWYPQTDNTLMVYPTAGQVNATTYSNNISPMAEYYVQFTKTGTHYVWVNGFANSSGLDNTCHIGMDGVVNKSSENMKFAGNNTYVWTNKNAAGEIAKMKIYGIGLHKINLWMNEDGAKVKQIFITDNADVVPQVISTGIDEVINNRMYTYPNPATNEVNIQLATISPKLTVSITDMLGKMIAKSDIYTQNGRFSFNVSTLKNGLYLIHVTDGPNYVISKLNIRR